MANKRNSKTIQWDEETIAEHDKERGTRQKIDEAPTPYRYDTGSATASEKCSHSGSPEYNGKTMAYVPSSTEELNLKTLSFSSGTDGMYGIKPPPCVNGSSSSISDNWEAVSARLEYERQMQVRL